MVATRDRFVSTASLLFQQKGNGATTVGEVADIGDLPIGSLCYHFPGGKEELGAAEVLYRAARFAEALRTDLAASQRPGGAVAGCATLPADLLEASQWRDGWTALDVAADHLDRLVSA